jgi:hypothetical protein
MIDQLPTMAPPATVEATDPNSLPLHGADLEDGVQAVIEVSAALQHPDRSAELNDVIIPFDLVPPMRHMRARELPGVQVCDMRELMARGPQRPTSVREFQHAHEKVRSVVLVAGCIPYVFRSADLIAVMEMLLVLQGLEVPMDPPLFLAVRPQIRKAKPATGSEPATGGSKSGLWFVELNANLQMHINALLTADRRVLLSLKYLVLSPTIDLIRSWVTARDQFLQYVLRTAPSAGQMAHTRFSKGLAPMTLQLCNNPLPGRPATGGRPPAYTNAFQPVPMPMMPYGAPAMMGWPQPMWGGAQHQMQQMQQMQQMPMGYMAAPNQQQYFVTYMPQQGQQQMVMMAAPQQPYGYQQMPQQQPSPYQQPHQPSTPPPPELSPASRPAATAAPPAYSSTTASPARSPAKSPTPLLPSNLLGTAATSTPSTSPKPEVLPEDASAASRAYGGEWQQTEQGSATATPSVAGQPGLSRAMSGTVDPFAAPGADVESSGLPSWVRTGGWGWEPWDAHSGGAAAQPRG